MAAVVIAPPQPVRVEAGGLSFEVRPLQARDGARLLVRLLGALAAGGSTGALDLGAIARAVSRPEFVDLYLDAVGLFATHATVETLGADGAIRTPKVSEVFEMLFSQRQAALGEFVLECLRINFTDFFDTLKAAGSGLGVTTQTPLNPSG